MIEIDQAAFILEIPTKIASANHIAFIQAIFGHRSLWSRSCYRRDMLLHLQTRRSMSLQGQPRSTSWKDVGQVNLATASPPRGGLEA